jgi:hypothetical protein
MRMLLLEGVSFNPDSVAYALSSSAEDVVPGCTVIFLNGKVLNFSLSVEEFTIFVNQSHDTKAQ